MRSFAVLVIGRSWSLAASLLSWLVCALVWVMFVSSVSREVSAMARYKHYEQAVVKSLDERRTVRHSRMPFRGERGVRCEECGDSLSPTHAFAVYGCWCVRCWQGFSLVVG